MSERWKLDKDGSMKTKPETKECLDYNKTINEDKYTPFVFFDMRTLFISRQPMSY